MTVNRQCIKRIKDEPDINVACMGVLWMLRGDGYKVTRIKIETECGLGVVLGDEH